MKKIVFFLTILACTIILSSFPIELFAQSTSTTRTRVGNPKTGGGGWPTDGWLSQGPETLGQYGHGSKGLDAIDVANASSPPPMIYSTFDGVARVYDCSEFGTCLISYGNVVRITPDINPAATIIYAHLSSFSVKDGDRVKKGDPLGSMGNTGNSTGQHLHYEFVGLPFAVPNIPQNIVPPDCEPPTNPCSPNTISSSDLETQTKEEYWFVLHRQSRTEDLYQGVPGDFTKSKKIKTFTIRPGQPNERPTPLPQLSNREYWNIVSMGPRGGTVGPYFLVLDIPYDNANGGPTPYTECDGGQCNWGAGDFGLHGTGGDPGRVNNDGSTSENWSSGCIRHFDADITDLYNLLASTNGNIRYYVENN